MLGLVIEKARQSQESTGTTDPSLKRTFINALARLIQSAMVEDPVFQAMVLRHRCASVSEFVALSESSRRDRQQLMKVVDALAHPGKQRQFEQGWLRDAMTRLYRSTEVSWDALADTLQSILALPQITDESRLQHHLQELLSSPELRRLRRGEILASNPQVRDYLALRDRHGAQSGSDKAARQGAASRQRGQVVEAAAAAHFGALAMELNQNIEPGRKIHVATSMHTPAVLAGGTRHAKTEWDVVLLKQCGDASPIWDVYLLVEAKSSMDAAIKDFPTLLRGLELLSRADEDGLYTFESREGKVDIRGLSLSALSTDEGALRRTVRYFCDEAPDVVVSALSPANRMRLLSSTPCLEYASRLMQGSDADSSDLEQVWGELLQSPRLHPVLHHKPVANRVAELVVHSETKN